MPSAEPRTSGSPPRIATATPNTPTAVQLMCQPVARSPSQRPATSRTMPGCSVWMTARTATDECCSAEKTNARLMPNSAPASAVRRSTSFVTRPPVAYVTIHTSGIDSQNRTDTPTSAGAEINFVIGGPSPQITTTPAITAVATAGEGSAAAVPGPIVTPVAPVTGAPVLTRSTVAVPPRRQRPGWCEAAQAAPRTVVLGVPG